MHTPNNLMKVPAHNNVVDKYFFKSPIRLIAYIKLGLFCSLSTILFSCNRQTDKSFPVEIEKPIPVSLRVSQSLKSSFDKYLTDSFLIESGDTLITANWLYQLFQGNEFKAIWTADSTLLPCSDTLLSIIESAEDFGLIPQAYNLNRIHVLVKHFTDTLHKEKNIASICDLNLLFTDAFFKMAIHLKKGRLDPDSLNQVWKGNSNDSDIVALVASAISNNKIRQTLLSFEPELEQYSLLKSHLNDQLDSGQYEKIVLNMERWRWEKKYYEDYQIFINLPSYMMKYYACDTLKLLSRIIIGKPETPSPSRLNSKIVYFYIYPYWNVPLSIATKEILPSLKKDTAYFTKHNMELLDAYGNVIEYKGINWKKYSEKYFPFKLRQRDGDDNTLGILKFIFPNKFDIYLHDTNGRHLFSKEKRALSHGCIRVKQAKKLAANLIDCCVINFNSDSLNNSLKNKQRKKVDLFNRVPVHIRYFSAEVDSNKLFFYDDIYGLDKKMLDNLLYVEK